MSEQKYLIVIGGATASGKTSFAIALARYYQTVILSADSRQFYKEMNIGTAKPDPDELEAAPHYFIGHKSIQDNYSVGDFEKEALALLRRVYADHNIAILVGGSGLYLKAICEGLDTFPEVPVEVKRAVELAYEQNGLTYLQEYIARVDPVYYASVDQNNPHRLMRALSVYKASGQPFSSFLKQTPATRFFTPIFLQLQWPRDLLYERINTRVDQMMERGLEQEAKSLHPYKELSALQTVGYQELFDYFEDKMSLPEAIALIKRNSRRYAKRQLTWYRRDGHWKSFSYSEQELAIKYIDTLTSSNADLYFDSGMFHYQTVPSLPYPVITDKYQQLLVKQTEGHAIKAFIFSRRKDGVILLKQWESSSEEEQLWILHELLLAHLDQTYYLFSSEEIDYPIEGFSLQLTAEEDLPAWIKKAKLNLASKHRPLHTYLAVSL